jgi:hypothetical protein
MRSIVSAMESINLKIEAISIKWYTINKQCFKIDTSILALFHTTWSFSIFLYWLLTYNTIVLSHDFDFYYYALSFFDEINNNVMIASHLSIYLIYLLVESIFFCFVLILAWYENGHVSNQTIFKGLIFLERPK